MISFDIENSYTDSQLIIGVDEAGRGSWMGPVMAAAVCFTSLNTALLPAKLNDSKQLTAKQRENIYQQLLQLHTDQQLYYGVASVSAQEIDRLNIRQATKLAMQKAIISLQEQLPLHLQSSNKSIIVDGNFTPTISLPALQHLDWVIGGDAKSFSIAAASVLAKVTRDYWVDALATTCPQYNWQHNKGYGTAEHLAAIKQYGIHTEHRRSFNPIKSILQPTLC